MPRVTRRKSSKKVSPSGLSSICIIVPAYNEADSIRSVVTKLQKIPYDIQIVVVNDGSHDATSEQVQDLGVTLIELPFNLGIGGAVQTGLKYALTHGFKFAAQVDADGQHDSDELVKILTAMKPPVDVVIGSRFLKQTKYRASTSRRLGIRFFSFLIKLITGQRIYDPTSGFRIYNQRAMAFLAHNYPVDFPEPESIVYLLNNNFVLKEVSVEMKPRVTGQSSLHNVKAIYLVISIAIGILVSAFKRNFVYVSSSR